jgi:hypothetical protein
MPFVYRASFPAFPKEGLVSGRGLRLLNGLEA